MQACTRCGNWHKDAEKHVGRYLSCAKVKTYWSELKRRHRQETGHLAMLKITGDGRIICTKYGRDLTGPL
jgi:hypothetical protein